VDLKRLGPYDILSPLGAGGFGEVYKARDSRLSRTVAIKILPSTDPELKARFEREAKTSMCHRTGSDFSCSSPLDNARRHKSLSCSTGPANSRGWADEAVTPTL
jgi:serine/threonine protein kinase